MAGIYHQLLRGPCVCVPRSPHPVLASKAVSKAVGHWSSIPGRGLLEGPWREAPLVWASPGLQQGGPSVVAFLVSGSWEREVILRDWGRVSEHANVPLSTSYFQILKHLKGEGETFWTGRFHGGVGAGFLAMAKRVGQLLLPPTPLELSFKPPGQNETKMIHLSTPHKHGPLEPALGKSRI